MYDAISYIISGFLFAWGVIVIVNTRETAETPSMRIFSLLVAVAMFTLSGLVLNAAI